MKFTVKHALVHLAICGTVLCALALVLTLLNTRPTAFTAIVPEFALMGVVIGAPVSLLALLILFLKPDFLDNSLL